MYWSPTGMHLARGPAAKTSQDVQEGKERLEEEERAEEERIAGEAQLRPRPSFKWSGYESMTRNNKLRQIGWRIAKCGRPRESQAESRGHANATQKGGGGGGGKVGK